MIPINLPKTDLNEVAEENRAFVLERRIRLLTEQINTALQSIDPTDITISDGKTLRDFLDSLDE